jgi:succinyl-CoA synthetase beta subunit
LWLTEQIVLKSQILAGGRGLGKFKSGLQGGVHIATVPKAVELAKQMLGGTLVTKQTGPAGKPVNTLYVARKMKLTREMYFAILLDRKTSGPMMIGCAEGGTSIEDLAEKFPDKIVKVGEALSIAYMKNHL